MKENNYERIKRYVEEIDKAKKDLAILEGRREELMSRIRDEFRINSIEKAKSILASLREELDELEKQFEEKMQYIEETYEL